MRPFFAILVGALVLLGGCGKPRIWEFEDTGVEEEQDTEDTGRRRFDGDGDGYYSDADCDDTDATVYPDAEEVCDEVDNDCDGRVDQDAVDQGSWYRDFDGDGYGDADDEVWSCEAPSGFVADATDCDDQSASAFPGASEVCDSLDNDCDGVVDGEDALSQRTWYLDEDGDGFGGEQSQVHCDLPLGYAAFDMDCDDGNDQVYPGADEYCDGLDTDCDGHVDESDALDARQWFADTDGDGFGDPDASSTACDVPSGHVPDSNDCDDSSEAAYPGAEEVCDGLDNDCDGQVGWGFNVPTDYGSLQDAIDAASTGEHLCLEPGTWVEDIDFEGKELLLEGGGERGDTILEGSGSGPVVTFSSAESADSILKGLTITGGVAQLGAGIYISSADPTLEDLVVRDNYCDSASCFGTGVYLRGSEAVLTEVEISSNHQENNSSTPYNLGAGLLIYEGEPSLVDVQILDNISELDMSNAGSAMGQGYGAGLYVAYADPVLTGVIIAGNRIEATSGSASGRGAGVYLFDSESLFENTIVADNSLEVQSAYGAGFYLIDSSPELFNVILAANHAGESSSTYASGGAIFADDSEVYLLNSGLVANVVEGSSGLSGSSISLKGESELQVINTDISSAASSGTVYGSAIYLASPEESELEIAYCNFYGNASAAFSGLSSPVGNEGNVSVNPQYTDTSASDPLDWDLSLDTGSDLRDAGDPSFQDTDGTTSDIGAYGGSGGGNW